MAQTPTTGEKEVGVAETGSLAEGIQNDTSISQTPLQQDAEAQRKLLNVLHEQTQNAEWNQKVMQDERRRLASRLSGLEGYERVIVPSQPSTKSFIPFGIDGTSVIISQYGEILRMSQHFAEEKPRIMCLTSPSMEGYERDLVYIGDKLNDDAQTRESGLNICLMPVSKAETPHLGAELEWINGRWPCVYYEIDGVTVSVLFTVKEGVLSQQYFITNISPEEKAIHFALQFGGAEVNTLRVKGNRWAGDDYDWTVGDRPKIRPDVDGSFHIVERDVARARINSEPDDTTLTRGEAVIAIFHNGSLVETEHIVPIPGRRYNSDSDGENGGHSSVSDKKDVSRTSRLLQIPSNGVHKLIVQYELRSYGSKDTRVLERPDVDTFLQGDQSGSWSFKQDHKFNSIWRRHLEHVLGLCQVKIISNTEHECQIAFINDITLELGSTPLNDFYIFRFLLMTYQILESGYQTCSTPIPQNKETGRSEFDKSALQTRIKETCKGHLRWCFSIGVILASQSWPLSSKSDDEVDLHENKADGKAFIGSLQMLKLSEFARVFREEALLISECLQQGANVWLDELIAHRDAKSELWYRDTRRTYVAWEGRRDEGSEWLGLPEYRLGDLVYIWKALKSLEDLVCNSDGCTSGDNGSLTSAILLRLNEKNLRHYDVRKLILQRFVYQNLDAPSIAMSDQHDPEDPGIAVPKTEPVASFFAIAVRRSRDRDRLLFYANDTLLYDGLVWGFFKDDLEVETLSTKNEVLKVNVRVSWDNTIRAQGVEREAIWGKPLWYALAIIMAGTASLDSSKSPEELEKVSWERLLGCVMPHGLFAEKIDWDTKLPEFLPSFYGTPHLPFSGSRRSPWEIPTLLLRKRFESLELDLFSDTTAIPALPEVTTQQDGSLNGEHDIRDQAQPKMKSDLETQIGISQDAKDIMRKRIILEKKRMRSHKKVEHEMVSDPLVRKVRDWLYPFPDFISQNPPYRPMEEEEKRLDQRLKIDLDNHSDDSLREKLEKILKRGVEKWRSLKPDEREEKFSYNTWTAVVVDVGRHRRDPDIIFCDADDLDQNLRKKRTVERAKKRFHYLGPLQVEHALILYLASPNQDKRNMAQFYIRHTSFLSHMQEDVHPLVDVWATELHLGFLQLVDPEKSLYIEEESEDYSVCRGRQRRFPLVIKGSQFDIYKASLSYRFVGDMGDKFWSGYLLTYLPGTSKRFPIPEYINWDPIKQWFHESTKNDQRKIFEPFLVERMAAEVYQSTNQFLGSIDEWLDPAIESPEEKKGSVESNSPKADDRSYDVQYNRSTTCLDLEATLNPLRRLSTANVESLRQWSKREMDRHYKPRWSEKDELKYRDLVDHQKRRADQQISLMEHQQGRIETCIEQVKSHRAQLTDSLNLTESRTAAHESENIRIFTYATVVFYPLSFVASLFSMQGPPSHSTTSIFVRATAIALVVTLLIVFNAEILAWPIRRLRYSISHTARKKMETTSNIFAVKWQTTLLRIKQAEDHDVLHDNEMPKWPRSKLIYLAFLFVYLLVEVPAHRLVLAYESLTRIEIRTPDRVALSATRILTAVIVLPVFAAAWSLLVLWSLLFWTLKTMWVMPQHKWSELQTQTEKKLLANAISTEKANLQDSENNGDRKGQPSGAQEEKSNKNQKQPKGQDSEEKFEEKRKQDRKENKERIRKQVSMLINPPELYDAKLKRYVSRKPKENDGQRIQSGKTSTVPSVLDENGVITRIKTGEQNVSPLSQGLIPSWLWPSARHRTEKAVVDEVAV